MLFLHPCLELGEPHWAPVPHPHRGARAPCLLLSVWRQKGTSCQSQVVGSTCPRLPQSRRPRPTPLVGVMVQPPHLPWARRWQGRGGVHQRRGGGDILALWDRGDCLPGTRVLSGPGSGAAAAAGSAGEVYPAHVSLQAAPPHVWPGSASPSLGGGAISPVPPGVCGTWGFGSRQSPRSPLGS